MAITVESVSTENFAEGSVSFTKPTGVALDDILVWVVACSDSNTISTPSGWSVVVAPAATGGDNDLDPYIFVKVADSGDVAASSYSIDVDDTSGQLGGVMMRISGGDIYTIQEEYETDDDGSTGTSRTHAFTINPTYDDSLLLAVGTGNGANTSSSYASTGTPTWTERFDDSGTSFNDFMFVATAPYDSTTEITSFTFSTSGSTTRSDVAILVLRPQIDGAASPSLITMGSSVLSPTLATDTSVSPTLVEMSQSEVLAPSTSIDEDYWSELNKTTDVVSELDAVHMDGNNQVFMDGSNEIYREESNETWTVISKSTT